MLFEQLYDISIFICYQKANIFLYIYICRSGNLSINAFLCMYTWMMDMFALVEVQHESYNAWES